MCTKRAHIFQNNCHHENSSESLQTVHFNFQNYDSQHVLVHPDVTIVTGCHQVPVCFDLPSVKLCAMTKLRQVFKKCCIECVKTKETFLCFPTEDRRRNPAFFLYNWGLLCFKKCRPAFCLFQFSLDQLTFTF